MVYLGSEVFHYSKRERWHQKVKKMATEQFPDSIGKRINIGLRPKVGGASDGWGIWWVGHLVGGVSGGWKV